MKPITRPPPANARSVPTLPAFSTQWPVINTQLQPIMAPNDNASTARALSTRANRSGLATRWDDRTQRHAR